MSHVIDKKYKTRLCHRCRVEPIAKGRQLYCGSQSKRTGCSYQVKLETNHKYYLSWKKRHPGILKEKQAKRIKDGYYKQSHIVESRKKTRRKIYLETGK